MIDALNALTEKKKTVGLKQSLKAVRNGRASSVILARDADRNITEPVSSLCKDMQITLHWVPSMADMGRVCQIDVPAAVVAIIRD